MLSGPNTPPTARGGGGVRGKRVCVPDIGLKFPSPLIKFHFLPDNFSDVGGGGGGRPQLARAPNTPPPPLLGH